MEDPRIRKFAQFLIRSAVGLEKGEKILIELHGSETGLMKALVPGSLWLWAASPLSTSSTTP